MKQKGPPRVERRRSTVELNLIGDHGKDRAGPRRRGCMPFSVLVISGGAALVLLAGLHTA